MQTITLEVEDSKIDIVLNIVKNLKDDIISKYEVVDEKRESKSFINLSEKVLSNTWDNEEDSEYDKFL